MFDITTAGLVDLRQTCVRITAAPFPFPPTDSPFCTLHHRLKCSVRYPAAALVTCTETNLKDAACLAVSTDYTQMMKHTTEAVYTNTHMHLS